MKKQKQVHRLPIQTARFMILFVGLVCVLITFRSYRMTAIRRKELQTNREKIEQRAKEIKRTGEDIRRSDDLEFAEEVAREDLGMVKPREVLYIDKSKDREGDRNKEDVK